MRNFSRSSRTPVGLVTIAAALAAAGSLQAQPPDVTLNLQDARTAVRRLAPGAPV